MRYLIKILVGLLILVILILIVYVVSNKNEIVEYKVNSNNINYAQLLGEIKKEFNPDNNLVYFDDNCPAFGSEYYYNYTYNTFTINGIYIIRNNKVFNLKVYYSNEKFIIRESKGTVGIDKVRNLSLVDEIMLAYDYINLNHIKEHISLNSDKEHVSIKFSPTIKFDEIKENDKVFVYSNTSKNYESINLSNIDSNQYVLFIVSKFIKINQDEYQNLENIYYFIEK